MSQSQNSSFSHAAASMTKASTSTRASPSGDRFQDNAMQYSAHASFNEAADDCTRFVISLRCKVCQFPNGPRQIVSRDRVAHKSAENLASADHRVWTRRCRSVPRGTCLASSRPCCIAVRRDFADTCRALMLGPSLAALRMCMCMYSYGESFLNPVRRSVQLNPSAGMTSFLLRPHSQ